MSRHITTILPHITSAVWKKRGLVQGRLFHEWPQIVGEHLSNYSWPEKITFSSTGMGTLHLRVSGGAALELQYMTTTLIDRINTYFGFAAIGKIFLKQGTSLRPIKTEKKVFPPLTDQELQTLASQLHDVTHPLLKTRLFELGKAVLQRLKLK